MKSNTLLTTLGTAILALAPYSLENYFANYAQAEQQTQVKDYENSSTVTYTKIRERTAKKLGNETVKVEFGLETKLWQNLKPGMTKQEFYNSIKNSPIELKTTTIFAGINGIRSYINSDDIKTEFLSAADRFIKNKPSQYDPQLTFSKKDKEVLEKMLERELISSLKETLKPWFGEQKEVYVYPPKSQILLRTDKKANPEFEMLINTSNTAENPSYKKLDIDKITDKNEKQVFTKFLWLSVLTKDPDNIIPIDNFYREYIKLKNQK